MGCYTYLEVDGEQVDGTDLKGWNIPSVFLFGNERVGTIEAVQAIDDYIFRYDVGALRHNRVPAAIIYAGDPPVSHPLVEQGNELQEDAQQTIDNFIDTAEQLQKTYGDRAVIHVNP